MLKQKTFEDIKSMVNEYIDYYNYERVVVRHKVPPAFIFFQTATKNGIPSGIPLNL